MNLLKIINRQRVLCNLDIDDIEGDGFSGGVGEFGGTSSPTTGGASGGAGGGTSGTTSGVIVPTLNIYPSTDQVIATGLPICFRASGSISLPQTPEQTANLTANANATYSGGEWAKTGPDNSDWNAETIDTNLIHNKQSCHIVAYNNGFVTPGGAINNSDTFMGLKSTGGYYFFWRVFKYCNATPGTCDSSWFGYVVMKTPAGAYVTLTGGVVEQGQQFKVKSNGNNIIWEFTTEGNWAYNYYTYAIPADAGHWQFFTNACYVGNQINNIRTYKGSYQAAVTEFEWTTSCVEELEIDGNQACYTPLMDGSCQVCVATSGVDPLCVDVLSVPLFLRPKDLECEVCE